MENQAKITTYTLIATQAALWATGLAPELLMCLSVCDRRQK